MSRLIALYPERWRARYEDEFLALLAERPPDVLERVDIVRGAIDARLHPGPMEPAQTPIGDGPTGRPRNRGLGWLTLLGIPVWFAAVVVAVNGPIVTGPDGSYREGSAAHPLVFTALALLIIGMSTAAAELPTGSRARPLVVIGALAGLLWAFAPWLIPAAAIFSGALAILGIASWRSRRWRGPDAVVMVGGLILAWGSLFLIPLHLLDDYLTFFVLFASTWLATGHALLRPVRRGSGASAPVRQA